MRGSTGVSGAQEASSRLPDVYNGEAGGGDAVGGTGGKEHVQSPGSLRRARRGWGRRERDDSEQGGRGAQATSACWWPAWGDSPSHLGSHVAPCQRHRSFAAPFSVMCTLPLPAPLSPPSPPTWTGMAASPLKSWSKFSSSNPQAAWSWKRASLFSVCLPLCLACALWHVLPGGSLSQRLRAQVLNRLPLRPWLPGQPPSLPLVFSLRRLVYRKRKHHSSPFPGDLVAISINHEL